MHHHLSRLLKHRLLLRPLPAAAASSPYAAAAFSTSSRKPYAAAAFSTSSRKPYAAAAFSTSSRKPYARRAKPPPPAATAGGDAADASPPAADAAAEAKAAWQREKLPGDLPPPPTVPFQPRVANTVRLVGTVGAPLHLQRTPDGRFSAVSVLVQDRRIDFPKFWVPIVFQDELAQVAASHLKENDLVYVSGQLTCDVPPLKLDDGQANIQVLAHLLSFVDSKVVKTDVVVDEEEGFTEVVEAVKKAEEKKVSSKYPAITVSGYKSKWNKFSKLWNDVITRPQDWNDNRPQKKDGSRSARYPDFTNKVSKEALWLDSAPTTVLEKLDDLAFGSGHAARGTDKPFSNDMQKGTNWSKFRKSPDTSAWAKQKLEEEELRRDLLDNPANWWDNRTDKRTPKHPDFKHKDSGKALWISTKSPQWAVDGLPSLNFKGGSKGTRKQETLLS